MHVNMNSEISDVTAISVSWLMAVSTLKIPAIKKTNKSKEQLVFEDDMTEEELKKLDDEIN